MADQIQRGGFVPVQPQDLEGPFTNVLTSALTPSAQPTEVPANPGQGKGATIARLGTKFLQGVAEGRLKAFQMAENDRLSKLNRLNSYVQSIRSNPNITDEAKQIVEQQYFRVLGPHMAAAGDEKGKGKGKGGEEQKQGLPHMIAHAMKEIGLGMAGGKLPKQMPDVSGAYDTIQKSIFDEKTGKIKDQYNVEGIVASNQAQIQDKLKQFTPGQNWYHEVAAAVMPNINAMAKYNPAMANNTLAQLQDMYPKAPPPGTMQAAIVAEQEASKPKVGAAPPGPAVSTSAGIIPGAGFGMPASSTTATPPGPTPTGVRPPQTLAERQFYGERTPVNLSDPANPNHQVSADYNPRTQVYEDRVTGIPLPPSQQSWLKETTPYHPPAAAQRDKKLTTTIVNGQAVDRMQKADGSYYDLPHAYAPDRWMAHFRVQDLRDVEKAKQRVLSEYPKQVRMVNSSWDQKIARVKENQAIPPSQQKTLAAEYESNRQAELDDLKGKYDEAITDIETTRTMQGQKKTGGGEKKKSSVSLSKEAESVF